MATPYSQDLRDRVLRAYDRGMKTKQIAVIFNVSPAWARRVKQRRRETGETTHRPMGGPGVTIVDRGRLAALVREHSDATLAELRALLGVQCALSTLCKALKQMGFSFKKNDPCGGAGASGCRAETRLVAIVVAGRRSQTIDIHRRNVGQDEHDPASRPRAAWPATGRQDPARTLADDHADRGAGHRRNAVFDRGRWSRQRRCLRSVRRAGAYPSTQSGRHCGDGQPIEPQTCTCTRTDRSDSGGAEVLASVQPRSESDRAGLQQDQAVTSNTEDPHQRCPLAIHAGRARCGDAERRHQLLPTCRIHATC